MKITKQQLKTIIKEEAQRVLQERRGLRLAQKIIETRPVHRLRGSRADDPWPDEAIMEQPFDALQEVGYWVDAKWSDAPKHFGEKDAAAIEKATGKSPISKQFEDAADLKSQRRGIKLMDKYMPMAQYPGQEHYLATPFAKVLGLTGRATRLPDDDDL